MAPRKRTQTLENLDQDNLKVRNTNIKKLRENTNEEKDRNDSTQKIESSEKKFTFSNLYFYIFILVAIGGLINVNQELQEISSFQKQLTNDTAFEEHKNLFNDLQTKFNEAEKERKDNRASIDAVKRKVQELETQVDINIQIFNDYKTENKAKVKELDQTLEHYKSKNDAEVKSLEKDVATNEQNFNRYKSENESKVKELDQTLEHYKSTNDAEVKALKNDVAINIQIFNDYKTENEAKVKELDQTLEHYKSKNDAEVKALEKDVATNEQNFNRYKMENESKVKDLDQTLEHYKSKNDAEMKDLKNDVATNSETFKKHQEANEAKSTTVNDKTNAEEDNDVTPSNLKM